MRIESMQQFAVVRGETAEELTEQLNRKLRELKGKNPQVKFEGLTAYIKYSEAIQHPECLGDEYELIGARFSCDQCPAYIPKCRRDGSIDRRCKVGGCPNTEYKKTYGRASACDLLYEMLMKGQVKICFTE